MHDIYPSMVWLNPTPQNAWEHTPSIGLVRDIIGPDKMFPMTLKGLDGAMRALSR
jgi:uncharacterized protein with von Willebrand factor type A (vWA) domain